MGIKSIAKKQCIGFIYLATKDLLRSEINKVMFLRYFSKALQQLPNPRPIVVHIS